MRRPSHDRGFQIHVEDSHHPIRTTSDQHVPVVVHTDTVRLRDPTVDLEITVRCPSLQGPAAQVSIPAEQGIEIPRSGGDDEEWIHRVRCEGEDAGEVFFPCTEFTGELQVTGFLLGEAEDLDLPVRGPGVQDFISALSAVPGQSCDPGRMQESGTECDLTRTEIETPTLRSVDREHEIRTRLLHRGLESGFPDPSLSSSAATDPRCSAHDRWSCLGWDLTISSLSLQTAVLRGISPVRGRGRTLRRILISRVCSCGELSSGESDEIRSADVPDPDGTVFAGGREDVPRAFRIG